MKRLNLLIFISILYVSGVIADSASPDELATKETKVNTLIKTENENKALHFGIGDLKKFSDAINDTSSLNCFEKRCVNQGQLKLTITGPPDDASINVDLGGYAQSITVDPDGNKLDFFGTLGDQFVGQLWADACRGQRLTELELINTSGSMMQIRTINLTLDNGNGLEKTIFRVDQPFNLTTTQPQRYSITEIKNSQAYQSAMVAACHD